ncbi:MAG: tetratricopeptide repeat protein [Thalassobaculum sp.]|uniref:tetratricopeptide repeat protein n=1 Tax=Thalassobaculum sp. TaxID=2022740 RepID=UPI0032F01241
MTRPAAAALAAVLMLLAVPAQAMAPTPSTDEAGDKAGMSDYAKAEALIDEERYAEAVPLLQAVVKRQPKNADGWSQLGFASRKAGNWKDGEGYYAKALALDPNHQEAMEYLGELYLETGRPKEAQALLAKLVKLCPDGCEARSELEEAIETHARKKK